MTWVKDLADGPTELDRVWGKRPDYYEVFIKKDYLRALKRSNPVLVELARIRISQLVESEFDQSLRYRAAADAGLEEAKIAELANYPTSDLFDERERVALEFTEQLVIQSSSITDDDCDRLQEHVSAEDFINFVYALSRMDMFARANSVLRIKPSVDVPAVLADDFLLSPSFAA